MLSQNNMFASEKEKQLLSYRPFDTTNSAEFFDSSLMMGLKRGERFDIVIGNPPYVRHEAIKELKPLLQKTYKTYSGTADLYCYFYEKGFDLLKQGGFLSYITSNKFLKAKYGEKIRNLFKNETIIRDLIDFGGYKVFDNATVDSIIFQFEKGFKVSNSFGVLEVKEKFSDLKSYFDKEKFEVKQEKLSNNSWTLGNNKILELKEKIEKQGIKLKDYCGEPKVGIKTGLNKVLIVNKDLKNKIIGNNIFENRIFKEVIFGKNITKYYSKFDNLFLIFPYIFDDNIGELKTINLDDFPNTKSYLLSFYDDLKNRATFDNGKKEWFELQQINKNINFDIGYIVFPDIGQKPSFSYKKGYSVDMTGFIIDKDNKFLVGLLNSKLIYFYFTLIASKLGNKGYRFKNQFINQLPIKQISPESQKPFIEKVDKILEITKQDFYDPKNPPKEQKDLEDEIDKMVYELYGLSEDEVRVVEESLV